ncbi:MAG: dienelactone hydrolase, partial [Chloroflexota bacterium]
TDSTYTDAGPFASTLLNRATDQLFVLDAIAKASRRSGFLRDLVDAEHTAVIGYSMGGYGALNMIGAGYNERLGKFVGPAVESRLASNPDYLASLDKRVKAAVLFAPWGSDLRVFGSPGVGFWDDSVMENITVPTLWIAGSADDVAGYAGIVRIFDHALNSERYLLTYDEAGHNVAPNPPPAEAVRQADYDHYADPVWDERRINNVNQHMITAFLGVYLRGNNDLRAYLTQPAENADLLGFPPGAAQGIELRAVPAW